MSAKEISQIQIRQTRTSTAPGHSGRAAETTTLSLGEKMDEYIFKMGCTSAHTLGVVVQLLTVGKIRLDFREHSERLQLESPSDARSRAEAMQQTEAYLASMRDGVSEPADGLDATQKIIIQAPKRTVL